MFSNSHRRIFWANGNDVLDCVNTKSNRLGYFFLTDIYIENPICFHFPCGFCLSFLMKVSKLWFSFKTWRKSNSLEQRKYSAFKVLKMFLSTLYCKRGFQWQLVCNKKITVILIKASISLTWQQMLYGLLTSATKMSTGKYQLALKCQKVLLACCFDTKLFH